MRSYNHVLLWTCKHCIVAQTDGGVLLSKADVICIALS